MTTDISFLTRAVDQLVTDGFVDSVYSHSNGIQIKGVLQNKPMEITIDPENTILEFILEEGVNFIPRIEFDVTWDGVDVIRNAKIDRRNYSLVIRAIAQCKAAKDNRNRVVTLFDTLYPEVEEAPKKPSLKDFQEGHTKPNYNITSKEYAVLNAIVDNEYQDFAPEKDSFDNLAGVWMFSCRENSGLSSRAFSGVCSSLSEKDMIGTDTIGDSTMKDVKKEDTYTIWMLKKGFEAWLNYFPA